MVKIINAKDFKENCRKEIDFDNPTCKDCNECCGIHSAISKTEKKAIEKFLRNIRNRKLLITINGRIKRRNDSGAVSLICPFSNEDKKCDIYPIRPVVCRGYHCSPKLKSAKLEYRIRNNRQTIGDIFGFGIKEFMDFMDDKN